MTGYFDLLFGGVAIVFVRVAIRPRLFWSFIRSGIWSLWSLFTVDGSTGLVKHIYPN